MMPGVALEDYVQAKLIVLWGVNPSATGIHLVPIIERARAAGAKLVVIDPRRTALARGADLHLAPRPGTDLPVALALIDALFSRGLADEGFLAAHATGVGELRRRAARWSLAAAAEIAGIEVAAIERFLAMYVEGAPAVIRAGWGLERNRNGGSAVAAVLALPAVAGKLGVRGGGFTMSNSSPGPRGWSLDPTAAIGAPPPATRTINMAHLGSALATTVSPRIEAVFVYNCNPAVTAPNQAEVIRELSRDDRFVVVHEQVMTDTARLADVVLPATHFLEHREIARGYGTMRLYDSAAVAEPEGEARSNTAVFGELLRRMGLDRPGEPMDDEGLAAAIFASDPRGAALRMALDAQGVAAPQPGSPQVPFVDAWPGTEDRKIHLVPEALDREAPAGLYGYQADPATAAYPLALISPALATQISSTFGQLRASPAAIELAPEDAAARGLRDGDPVRAWNALAEVRCAVRVNPDVRPGVAVLTKGTWRRFTSNGLGANALIPETTADLGGQAAFNDARIEVARAEGGAP
jgi:anaerobic selenocysteine-containing dehydrogenase